MIEDAILIRDAMTFNPVCVGLDDRLHLVKKIFDEKKFRHLLVVDDGVLIGILSDRDLLRNISPNIGKMRYTVNDVDTLDQPVHKIITRNPITLNADTPLKEAIKILSNAKFSSIPIVDEENRPIGILSWRDILKKII